MVKKPKSIYVDEDIWKRAIELGVNVSRVCENKLRILVDMLESKENSVKIDLKLGSYEVDGVRKAEFPDEL